MGKRTHHLRNKEKNLININKERGKGNARSRPSLPSISIEWETKPFDRLLVRSFTNGDIVLNDRRIVLTSNENDDKKERKREKEKKRKGG